MRSILPSVAGLAVLLLAGLAPAEPPDPAQIQAAALARLVQADEQFDAGAVAKALAGYQSASESFRKLAEDFPAWQPDDIQARLKHCQERIAALQPDPGKLEDTEPLMDGLLAELAELGSESLANPDDAQALLQEGTDSLPSPVESLLAEITDLDGPPPSSPGAGLPLLQEKSSGKKDAAVDHLWAEMAAGDDSLPGPEKTMPHPSGTAGDSAPPAGPEEPTHAAEKQQLQEKLARQQAELDELHAKLTGQDELLQARTGEIQQLQAQLNRKESEKDALAPEPPSKDSQNQDDLPDLRKREREAQSALKDLNKELAGNQKKIRQLEERNQDLDRAQSRTLASLDRLQGELAAKEKQLSQLVAETRQLRSQMDGGQNVVANLQATLAAKDRQLEQLEQNFRQLQDSERKAQSSVKILRTELAGRDQYFDALQREIQARSQLSQTVGTMENRINELTARNRQLEQDVAALGQERDQAETRARQAEAKQQDAESRARRAVAALAQAQPSTSVPPPPAATAKEPVPEPPVAVAALAQEIADPTAPESAATEAIRQLLEVGDNQAALAAVRQARQADPADVNLAHLEGIALIRRQSYTAAAALLTDLARNNPRHAEIHAALGAAMMGAGFHEEARDILLMAARLDKQMPECLFNLAQLHAFIDPVDLKLARRFYHQARALGLAPDPRLEEVLK